MQDKRLKLHEMLCDILGSRNVYFQPPENLKLTYPAIVYSRSGFENVRADNGIHKQWPKYTVTLIDPKPDSRFVEMILQMRYCRFDRHYVSDNLNHDVFTLYI